MTPLRQKMIDGKASMQLRGLSARTQESYVYCSVSSRLRVLFGDFKTQIYRLHRGRGISIYVNLMPDFSGLFASSGAKSHPKNFSRSNWGAITPANHLFFQPQDQAILGGEVRLISFCLLRADVCFGGGFRPGQSTRRTYRRALATYCRHCETASARMKVR
jgi:hypothetical protein